MELATRIRKVRQAYGYTQADIAYKINISPQAYGKIERNAAKTKFETFQKIANALEVDLVFLLDVKSNIYKEKNNL
ncbi:MAG: helix-turn-helix transcriptional regulator [Flavobacterium sp.]|jgi:transcriptional regulator with XRE-family HTH domain|nr:helix-turn-helix transcriptional regulator [Flavobacterium sp.]